MALSVFPDREGDVQIRVAASDASSMDMAESRQKSRHTQFFTQRLKNRRENGTGRAIYAVSGVSVLFVDLHKFGLAKVETQRMIWHRIIPDWEV